MEKLKIGDSTLRTWCLALEKEQNYNIIRTDHNKRMFTDKDLFVLSQFKILVQYKNLFISNAAAEIASKNRDDGMSSSNTESEQLPLPEHPSTFLYETVKELKAEMEQVKEMNQLLLIRLDEQHKYVDQRLDEKNDLLTQSLRVTLEAKKLLLESKKAQAEANQLLLEQKAAETHKKAGKGILTSLFG
ncbi:hypothetical protein [Peribacillus deserti]|uniref:HTH merR-type domain-containing protein n=1 Tax=Peribacillus deserti TaxID=673318 RepID=A0A2N5M2S2_9BACI|nr:hypothetical protein [Peribacillus deserti]PLT28660.1 hypothetical protein CUU66_17330 [Peribacillus deserti]